MAKNIVLTERYIFVRATPPTMDSFDRIITLRHYIYGQEKKFLLSKATDKYDGRFLTITAPAYGKENTIYQFTNVHGIPADLFNRMLKPNANKEQKKQYELLFETIVK